MNKATFLLGIGLIITMIFSVLLFRKYRELNQEHNLLKNQHEKAIASNNAVPLSAIDTLIPKVSSGIITVYNTIKTTEPIEGYVSKGLADTLAIALKVATKEIDRLTSMQVTASAKGKGDRIVDTTSKTEWLVMQKDPVFEVKVNLKNDSIFPSAKIKLSQANAPFRKNIFSRYEYRTAIMANDPRIKISEVYNVTKVPKSPRWGLGVTFGPVFIPQGISWGASVGLSYDIIQF